MTAQDTSTIQILDCDDWSVDAQMEIEKVEKQGIIPPCPITEMRHVRMTSAFMFSALPLTTKSSSIIQHAHQQLDCDCYMMRSRRWS
jgi:hypothetical protein